jgi:transposase
MSGHGSTGNFAVVSTRRIWSHSEKLRIVSEAVAPGAIISAVARRHALASSLLYRWIKSVKADDQVQKPSFVPVALAAPAGATVTMATVSDHRLETSAVQATAGNAIEVVLGNGRILRIGADIDMAVLKRLAAALEDRA